MRTKSCPKCEAKMDAEIDLKDNAELKPIWVCRCCYNILPRRILKTKLRAKREARTLETIKKLGLSA